MISSSAFLALAGAACTFGPVELLTALDAPHDAPLPVLIQLTGSLFFAFAIANWTAKASIIGGIYDRPLSLGNLVHFLCGALALLKHSIDHGFQPVLTAILAAYVVFALCFAYLVFGPGPVRAAQP
jgi:hypothetical protein